MYASGVTPSSLALDSFITINIAAPSFIPEALPAVTVPPSFLKAGFNLAKDSTVTPSLINSSSSTTVTFPLRPLTSTGTISSLNLPSALALEALF